MTNPSAGSLKPTSKSSAIGEGAPVDPKNPFAAAYWIAWALTQVGVREIVGPKHSAVIMGWVRELGAKALGMQVNDDETPWCGTFAGMVMKKAGLSMPAILVRASQWGRAGNWGRELLAPRPGCIMVFTRNGGGHVGFYMGETATHFRILGGNQSNSVNLTWIAKDRLAEGGMRWPKGVPLPAAYRIHLKPNGEKASTNEA